MRFARAVVSGVCVALLCAACVPRSEGDNKVNPEHEAAAEVAQHLHSIEEFQRDVEPAIVAARNEFLTQKTIVELRGNDSINELWPGQSPLYTLLSR